MTTDNKIRRIVDKLAELKRLDGKFEVFGAESHKYLLNKVKPASEIEAFQRRHDIVLPEGYAAFLQTIGDGGAGPYYGLQPLEDSLFVDLDYKRKDELLNPSLPFTITAPWNMELPGDDDDEQARESFADEYYDARWANGLLRICNYGCGVSLNLVVNGPEYGNIWVDDRGNDAGLYPDPYFGQEGRTQFLDWYELWLDSSLKEARP